MHQISVNQQLAEILTNHEVSITQDEEFIYANLSEKLKFKARSTYTVIENHISSQLDVMIVINNGEQIIESFGDFGLDIESAVNKNLKNFCSSSLHPLLAAFGDTNQRFHDQVTIEEWEIGRKSFTAYIGNLTPKTNSEKLLSPDYALNFFKIVEKAMHSQILNKDLHWFRGYYSQHKGEITNTEFLINNQPMREIKQLFSSIQLIPDIEFYSCRIFIVLKINDKRSGLKKNFL